jgi:hypothetical protein
MQLSIEGERLLKAQDYEVKPVLFLEPSVLEPK